MCETEVVNDTIELYYKLNDTKSDSFYSRFDSKGKHIEKNISKVIGQLKFHTKLILTNTQPMKAMMLLYPQNIHLRTDEEVFVECVIVSGSDNYADEVKLRFSAGK